MQISNNRYHNYISKLRHFTIRIVIFTGIWIFSASAKVLADNPQKFLAEDGLYFSGFTHDIKEPEVSGDFYPEVPEILSQMIDVFLETAAPASIEDDILVLISPHAGYEYSGLVASYGYKLVKDKPYKTAVIIGPSHSYRYRGISIYQRGGFRTPLGVVSVDEEFALKLLDETKGIRFIPEAFSKEHSIEVQIPFLQKVLSDFKIVPILMGEVNLKNCRELADILVSIIGSRKDVLIIASTDMYHGFDFRQAEAVDGLTLSYLQGMNPDIIYKKLTDGTIQLCGGFAVVTAMLAARRLGYNKLDVLNYTNSAEVTGRKIKGIWTVGYTSCAISQKR